MARYAFIVLTALLAVFTSGCISQQETEFRGVIRQGPTTASAPRTNSIHDVGAEVGCCVDSLPEAMTGYQIGQSTIFFVYNRKKYVANDCRLSNDMHPTVYFANWRIPLNNPGHNFWQTFLSEDVATRERTEGLRRLNGTCDVEKWKESGNFRIRLDLQSPGPDPVTVNGILTTYDHWQFNPVLGIGLILGSAGIAGE